MNSRITLTKVVSCRLLATIFIVTIVASGLLIFSFFQNNDIFITPFLPIFVGAIGGLVALQRRLKDLSKEDLGLLATSKYYFLLSPFIGGMLATLLFILFLSGLVRGELFPNFVLDINMPPEHKSNFLAIFDMGSDNPADYAKLIFWSFMAGFSEKLVINVISQFETSIREPKDQEHKDHSTDRK